jgi:hypothetical protein
MRDGRVEPGVREGWMKRKCIWNKVREEKYKGKGN